MSSSKIVSIPVLSEEALAQLPESIRVYIRYLETRIHELESRLSKDSSNSSKPPSSDGLQRKPKSLRGRSGKKPGGAQGHVGKGLMQVSNPDEIVTHTPISCAGCGSNLNNIPIPLENESFGIAENQVFKWNGYISGTITAQRQVFDIPQPKINVTEHRVEEKTCPCCFYISMRPV